MSAEGPTSARPPQPLRAAAPSEPEGLGGGAAPGAFDATLGDSSAAAPADVYAVKLSVFEGPLDLLLHLIRQNEVEISDIPVSHIAGQYLEYLELMRELNIDVAGEYLVMAATLALIKSRMLLPAEPGEEDEELGDPRAELVQRLLDYARYKEVAEELGRRRLLGRDVFEVQGAEPDSLPQSERPVEVGLFQLLQAFREVVERAKDAGPGVHEVEAEPVTVRERMIAVMDVLERSSSIEFVQLFEEIDGNGPTRAALVATFLAILELARLAALQIYQGASEEGAPEGPIRLRNVPLEGEGSSRWSERISEFM